MTRFMRLVWVTSAVSNQFSLLGYMFFSMAFLFWYGSTLLADGVYNITQFFVAFELDLKVTDFLDLWQ
jgi:hypothetical protein